MRHFLTTLQGRSAGEALDIIRRKVQLRRWRQRDHIAVRQGKASARLQTRRRSSDAEVVWQCFVANQYEVPRIYNAPPLHHDAVQRFHANLVRAGRRPLIIDCGANIGAASAWFALRYPTSQVVAVEPARANVEVLKANAQALGNVAIVQAGVGGADGSAYVLDGGGGHWGYQTGTTESTEPVRIVSLASLIDASVGPKTVPFILKIDIEGAEKDLFDHSLEKIARFPVIIFEPHDFYMPGARTASPFFKFHAEYGRDFAFGYENVFSLDMGRLAEPV